MPHDLLTTQQAADALAVARSRVYQMINEGQIETEMFGKAIGIPVSEIERLRRERDNALTGSTHQKGGPGKPKPTSGNRKNKGE